MNNKLAGRKVKMFRCHIDPAIPPTPRNAFMPEKYGATAYINDEATGLIHRGQDGREHVVFSANIQAIELFPEEVKTNKNDAERKLKGL